MAFLKGIQFNRQELSGAFGDMGTDFPLLVAIILASGMHAPSVLIVFGIMQILTGIIYKMPMPVQPLKAMATIIIAQKVSGGIIVGAGLAIGVVMLVLSLTGLLSQLARLIPKAVVRGIQLGLGISLCLLSFKNYIAADGQVGYAMALLVFIIIVLFLDKKHIPVTLLVIATGIAYALVFKVSGTELRQSAGLTLPVLTIPVWDDVVAGFFLLTLPQIPLSLGNSIIATRQVSKDLFPEQKPLEVRKIGLTYGLMNILVPFFGGVPVCHGSGGMVGHYTFGGRTGGSVIMYGLLYISLGLFFGNGFQTVVQVFPLPVLGVILLFEGLALMLLIKDTAGEKRDFIIALLVGVLAAGLPYGFVISIVVGTALFYSPLQLDTLMKIGSKK